MRNESIYAALRGTGKEKNKSIAAMPHWGITQRFGSTLLPDSIDGTIFSWLVLTDAERTGRGWLSNGSGKDAERSWKWLFEKQQTTRMENRQHRAKPWKTMIVTLSLDYSSKTFINAYFFYLTLTLILQHPVVTFPTPMGRVKFVKFLLNLTSFSSSLLGPFFYFYIYVSSSVLSYCSIKHDDDDDEKQSLHDVFSPGPVVFTALLVCPTSSSPAFSITSNYTEYASERLVWPSRQIQYRRTRSANTDADKYTRARTHRHTHTHTYIQASYILVSGSQRTGWFAPRNARFAVVIIRRRRRYTGQNGPSFNQHKRLIVCTHAWPFARELDCFT